MNLGKFVSNLKFKAANRIQAAKYGKMDFGIFKVAYMVAALDGEVTDVELKALNALLKKCRGYTKSAADKVLNEAMHSAGFLMLSAKALKDADLVKAFVREAQDALPDGFAYFSGEEVRRAVVTWMALGMSDGDYSAREKKCIEALRNHFVDLRVSLMEVEDWKQCHALTPAFRVAYGSAAHDELISLFPTGFELRAEELVSQYGDEADAAKELEKLIKAE